MVVGGLGVPSGIVDAALTGEMLLLTVGAGWSVMLGLDVEDSPIAGGGFEPTPVEGDLPNELVDPDTPPGTADPDTGPDRLSPEKLDDERLDPDTAEDPGALDRRLVGAGDADIRDVPLLPAAVPEAGESGVPFALLRLDDNGLVELKLLPAVGLDTLDLGVHGCRNGVGSTGGVTGEVGSAPRPVSDPIGSSNPSRRDLSASALQGLRTRRPGLHN